MEEKALSVKDNKTPWDLFKSKKPEKVSLEDDVKKDYINDDNFLVPKQTLAFYATKDTRHNLSDVIESLIGHPNRDWFAVTAFSFCLPLTIANQYGFVVKSNWDMEITWDGNIESAPQIKSEGWQNHDSIQPIIGDFANGIISLENKFIVRTPRDTNLMIMQPPNYFIPGLHTMSAVVEADNLRRNFTFNIKVTEPNKVINIKKGDWLAAFIPIPRFYVDSFELKDAFKLFGDEVIKNELESMHKLGWERNNQDYDKINGSGRRYFKGKHVNETLYRNHQKRAGLRDG